MKTLLDLAKTLKEDIKNLPFYFAAKIKTELFESNPQNYDYYGRDNEYKALYATSSYIDNKISVIIYSPKIFDSISEFFTLRKINKRI